MLRPPGIQKLINEQKNSRLRSPLITNPKSHLNLRHINWVVIQARLFRRWLSGSQRLKGLALQQEVHSRFRLTRRETFLLLALQYSFVLFLLFG